MNAAPQPTRDPSPERAHALVKLPEEVLAQVEAELAVHGEAAGDRAAQRVAEIRLLEVLRAEKFTGPRFERLIEKMMPRLVGYAFPIMNHWIRNGHIFDECLKFRRPIIKQARAAASEWTLEEQEAFAADSIIGTDKTIGGVEFFLDYGLLKEHWDPEKGASAATYFVGACACCFTQVCNKWWKDKVIAEAMLTSPTDVNEEGEEDLLLRVADPSHSPEELVVLRDTAARAMAQVKDPKVQEVLLRRSLGETQVEAAAAVDLSPKAAERRLHTQRQHMRGNESRGGHDAYP